jgi:hypothetical protein
MGVTTESGRLNISTHARFLSLFTSLMHSLLSPIAAARKTLRPGSIKTGAFAVAIRAIARYILRVWADKPYQWEGKASGPEED